MILEEESLTSRLIKMMFLEHLVLHLSCFIYVKTQTSRKGCGDEFSKDGDVDDMLQSQLYAKEIVCRQAAD